MIKISFHWQVFWPLGHCKASFPCYPSVIAFYLVTTYLPMAGNRSPMYNLLPMVHFRKIFIQFKGYLFSPNGALILDNNKGFMAGDLANC
jgi:hypothetical protein